MAGARCQIWAESHDLNHKPIDLGAMIDYGACVNGLSEYCKDALKLAVVKNLGSGEGYSAKIPGFAGLVVFAPTRAEVVRELKSALEGWIELSLARGDGLPALHALETVA